MILYFVHTLTKPSKSCYFMHSNSDAISAVSLVLTYTVFFASLGVKFRTMHPKIIGSNSSKVLLMPSAYAAQTDFTQTRYK